MWSLSLVMSECSLSGRGQGHVSNFYIVDWKFRHSKSSVYRWYPQLVRGRFVYDTYRTIKATRSCHGWVHMFIAHCPTVTLQVHNIDLVRTCLTSSFCTVAWQLARFQLTRRIARSLGDNWASCLVWCGGMNWVGLTSAFCVGVRPAVALRRPKQTRQNAPVWRSSRLNSHRYSSHDKTVLSMMLLTCSDFKFSVGDSLELSGIQFTPPKRTRHRQHSFVVSGVAMWISYKPVGVAYWMTRSAHDQVALRYCLLPAFSCDQNAAMRRHRSPVSTSGSVLPELRARYAARIIMNWWKLDYWPTLKAPIFQIYRVGQRTVCVGPMS